WQPAIYTLDLLLPVLDLGQEAAWRTSGASQWIALFLVILGWLLATIVTAGAAAVILHRN
ncbi:oxidoreductase, partial [Streptomyces chartreusis]